MSTVNPTIVQAIDQKLIRSGEKDRLKEYLRQRLTECGWKDHMRAYAKEVIQKRPHERLTVDEIIDEILPKGTAMVPETVKTDLLLRVRSSLQSAGSIG